MLAAVCERVPGDERLCTFNTHSLYQSTPAQRAGFAAAVDEVGRGRGLFRVDCEWYGELPEARVTEYADGERSTTVLAHYDAHGRWIDWTAGG